MFISNL
jgi:hypothetical protein